MQYWKISSYSNGWSSANCTPADCSPPADLITCINGSVTKLLLQNQGIALVPPFLCDLKNLTVIDLSNNNIYGEFPKVFYNCSKLEYLDLLNNNLSGTVHNDIHRMARLRHLNLGFNNIYGELPKGFYNCSKLKYLDLAVNDLSGTIHDDIHSMSRLGYLNLEVNSFSGNIPASIGQLTELTTLRLSSNQFNGSFPLEIGNLSNLEVLDLSYNTRITPTRFPSNFTHLKKLKSLSMSSTNLIGEIPYTIGEMTALEYLDLSTNNLSGEIPKEFGFLRGRTILNLENNQLSGRIPIEFDNEEYYRSFDGNPGLCARTCSLDLRTSKNYSRFLALIISLIIAALLVLLASFFVIRIYRKKKHGLESTWKLTTFQRLNFTESDILSRLTENNVIGSGGSGKVYRVAINHSHDVVAVKRFWSNKKLEEELEREFFAEVRILSSIQHSNIVKLLCCISNDNSKLLVYEYLENHSLDQWLHGTSGASTVLDSVHHIILDWPKRLQIAVGVAQGLCYMHHACSPPIVHRDVKSSNILLDSEFNAKVADFGLARMMITQGEQVTMSTVAGSFGYIAPGV
jgi:Leucine-rich repeat (LRR) protein/tRNA A-37 threonylcarbamoyl transferase component Bud32